jgi:beta-1,4-mannosyl-glycoprotein beta-1,4-N-acetylglucosaminyltransferase
LIGDVDEVPTVEALAALSETSKRGPVAFKQRNYYYYLNMLTEQRWYGSLAMALRWRTWLRGEILGTIGLRFQDLLIRGGPQAIRDARPTFMTAEGAGWHWSFLGGVDAIIRKIDAFAHAEHKGSALEADRLRAAIAQGRDPFGRWYLGFHFRPVPVDDRFPRYLRENVDRYPDLFYPV